jgi:hypothetical protein
MTTNLDSTYGGFIPTDRIMNRHLDQLTISTRQQGVFIDHDYALYFVEILSNSAQILNNHAVCARKEHYNKVFLILSAYLSQPIPSRLLALGKIILFNIMNLLILLRIYIFIILRFNFKSI